MEGTDYKPIDCGFYDVLESIATQRIYSKIQYHTEIGELVIVDALIKTFETENGAEFIILVTGEKIRLDYLIKINNYISPKYSNYYDFRCDC
jgi:Rho-binding antiterminator